MAPIPNCLKKGEFKWTKTITKAFTEINGKLISAPVLRLPDFSERFKVACDASGIRIGGVLSLEGHPVAFFSKKLNESNQGYSTYDREFDAVVQGLGFGAITSCQKDFILYFDHQASGI